MRVRSFVIFYPLSRKGERSVGHRLANSWRFHGLVEHLGFNCPVYVDDMLCTLLSPR